MTNSNRKFLNWSSEHRSSVIVMDRHQKTTGIILRRISLNESDQIITVLTKDQGKLSCIAKGSRRLKSKFCGRLEPFYEVDLTYFTGRDLEHLNEVELITARKVHEVDLKSKSILFYISEITNKLVADGQQVEGVYELLSDTLDHLDEIDGNNEAMLYGYLVKFLTLLGFMAPWDTCSRTNTKLNLSEPLYLNQLDASIVRSGYASPTDTRLTPSVIKWVNYMQKEPLPSIKNISASRGEQNEVWFILQSILGNILNYPLRSEAFLQTAF